MLTFATTGTSVAARPSMESYFGKRRVTGIIAPAANTESDVTKTRRRRHRPSWRSRLGRAGGIEFVWIQFPACARRKGKIAAAELNILLPSISNGWMSYPKLLKPPAQRLLLTFVMTAGMAVSISAASPRIPPRQALGHQAPVLTRSRARPAVDYSQIEGVQRWGLNE